MSVRFVAEVESGEIEFDSKEIINVKWFDIDEIKNMTKENLRTYESNMSVINNCIDKKIYPLETFDNKQYID